jgi:hypothetical protein
MFVDQSIDEMRQVRDRVTERADVDNFWSFTFADARGNEYPSAAATAQSGGRFEPHVTQPIQRLDFLLATRLEVPGVNLRDGLANGGAARR